MQFNSSRLDIACFFIQSCQFLLLLLPLSHITFVYAGSMIPEKLFLAGQKDALLSFFTNNNLVVLNLVQLYPMVILMVTKRANLYKHIKAHHLYQAWFQGYQNLQSQMKDIII